MPKPDFERVEKIFNETVELPAERRAAFLDRACAGDDELRAAVLKLLRHDEANTETDSFLISPVTQAASQLRPTHPTIPTTADAPDIPGYEIIGNVGRGGMGIVYKARQVKLNRIVALKMLLSPEFAGPEQLARFRTEAELLARIHQPNIVPIYDVGEFENRPYFTMEFIDGPNLSQFLSGRSQESRASAHVVELMARAVHAVHEAGIIHRDLKPANVLLKLSHPPNVGRRPYTAADLQTAIPKISDFGLAKDWTNDSKLTQTGMTMGTPCYMAPEQARRYPTGVGPAADIYSLGAILYEMLTGRPPFDAATPAETLALLLNDEPLSPAQLKPGLPGDLVTICLKCLEKLPHKRYASALDLAEDLRRYQAGEPIHARPVGSIERAIRWCRRHPLAAGFATLSAFLAVAFVVAVFVYESKLLAQATALAEQERKQIVQLNIIVGGEKRNDGDLFAAALRFAEALRLDDPEYEMQHRARIAEVLRNCPRLLQIYHLNRGILCSRVTESGILVATLDENHKVEIRDVVSGKPVGRPFPLETVPKFAALSNDGRFFAAVDASGKARIWNVNDGTPVDFPDQRMMTVQNIVFSPTHPVLLTKHTDANVRRWDLSSGRPELQPLPDSVRAASMCDDAHWHFTMDADGFGRLSDLTTGNNKAKFPLDDDLHRVSVSRDGEHIAAVSKDHKVHTWHIGVKKSVPIMHLLDDSITHAHFSHDSKRLALMNGNGTIRICDAGTGQAVTPMLRNPSRLTACEFNKDGNLVVTVTDHGEVRVWELAGAPPREKTCWDLQPDRQPIEDLIALLQLHSHHCVNEQQQLAALAADRIRELATWAKSLPQ